jgi:hypothetical protein
MATLDDVLTVQKNGVIAINGLNQTMTGVKNDLDQLVINTGVAIPSLVSPTVLASTTTLIVAGAGRIYGISIPAHGGSGQVFVYNSATTGGISASNCIFASDAANAANFQVYYSVNLAYTAGLVIKTDAAMNCCVSYSPNPT